jgi:hypothetical protein
MPATALRLASYCSFQAAHRAPRPPSTRPRHPAPCQVSSSIHRANAWGTSEATAASTANAPHFVARKGSALRRLRRMAALARTTPTALRASATLRSTRAAPSQTARTASATSSARRGSAPAASPKTPAATTAEARAGRAQTAAGVAATRTACREYATCRNGAVAPRAAGRRAPALKTANRTTATQRRMAAPASADLSPTPGSSTRPSAIRVRRMVRSTRASRLTPPDQRTHWRVTRAVGS